MLRKRRALWLEIGCTLTRSGCATHRRQEIPSPDDLFAAVNRAVARRPLNTVLLRYRQPDGTVPYGRLTVYQFQAAISVRLQERVTTTTTGRVGTSDSNVPYAERTTGRQGYN